MRQFLLTSTNIQGHIETIYNSAGKLVRIDMMQAELNYEQINRVLQVMPLNVTDFSLLPKTVKVTEVPMEVTFDMFWLPHRKKVNRIRVEKEWAKLTTEDKMLAVTVYKDYVKACDRTNRKELDPENYLKNRSWQTDWKNHY